MENYFASVGLTKMFGDVENESRVLQKKFACAVQAQHWLDKTVSRFNANCGIKSHDGQLLCFVGWYSLNTEKGKPISQCEFLRAGKTAPRVYTSTVVLDKTYPATNSRITLTRKDTEYRTAFIWTEWAYIKFKPSGVARVVSVEIKNEKGVIVYSWVR